MSLGQRIETLRKRHAEIDHLLHTEETRPNPDITRLHNFKREKLRLKDEILQLSQTDKGDKKRAC